MSYVKFIDTACIIHTRKKISSIHEFVIISINFFKTEASLLRTPCQCDRIDHCKLA